MKLKKLKNCFKSDAYDERHYLEFPLLGATPGPGSLDAGAEDGLADRRDVTGLLAISLSKCSG